MTTTDAESVGIDQDIKDLVEQSRQQIDAEKQKEKAQQEKELRLLRESRNRWRLLVAGAVLFSVLMFGAVLFILNQQSQLSKSAADLAAQLAQSRSREVAAVANNLLENGEAEEALLLGIIAQQGITGTMQSEEVLRTALDAWRGVASISGLEAAASGIFFSRDNRYLLTGGNDRKARVWDWQSRRLVWALGGHEDTLVGAALSFDGKYVVTASKNDRRVRVWRMSDGGLEWEKIHDDVVRSISLHPGGKWLGVRSGTKIWIWDIASGVLVGKSPYLAESGAQLRTLSWTTDGESILAGADDNLAHIWRIADGASGTFNVPEGRGHQFTVIGAQQSPDGRAIVSLSTDLLELWIRKSISSSYEYVELPDSRNTDGYRFHALFSPDSRYLAAGSANGKVRVWDLGSLEDRPIQLAVHTQEINGLTFSPDSRFLVSGSRDGTIRCGIS
ncbi:MAG: WD40 repeat domain-containing protein [Anaerolineales bacterium]|nr:WD40 repeat domain-containing protein [Anaerolineales bacterium]